MNRTDKSILVEGMRIALAGKPACEAPHPDQDSSYHARLRCCRTPLHLGEHAAYSYGPNTRMPIEQLAHWPADVLRPPKPTHPRPMKYWSFKGVRLALRPEEACESTWCRSSGDVVKCDRLKFHKGSHVQHLRDVYERPVSITCSWEDSQ